VKITEYEKLIYNKYLISSRTNQNKPFKLRKDFSDIDENTLHLLKKLSLFFNKFTHVSVDDFFNAPWAIYPDHNVFDLKFYSTQRALKIYTLYINRRSASRPDTEEQLYDIKKSLQYILKFCISNKIQVSEYIDHKTNNVYTFMLHLREHKVNIYTLFGFNKFESNMNNIDQDHIQFMLGELQQNMSTFRTNYISSTKAKHFIQLGISKIQTIQNKSTKQVENSNK